MPLFTRKDGMQYELSDTKIRGGNVGVLFEIAESLGPKAVENFACMLINKVIDSAKEQLKAGTSLLRQAIKQGGQPEATKELAANIIGWGDRLLAGEALLEHGKRLAAWTKIRKDCQGEQPTFHHPPNLEAAVCAAPGSQAASVAFFLNTISKTHSPLVGRTSSWGSSLRSIAITGQSVVTVICQHDQGQPAPL